MELIIHSTWLQLQCYLNAAEQGSIKLIIQQQFIFKLELGAATPRFQGNLQHVWLTDKQEANKNLELIYSAWYTATAGYANQHVANYLTWLSNAIPMPDCRGQYTTNYELLESTL